jgi:hypothetical protein
MAKGRLIGGTICLALAVLLAVLVFALPEDRMIFVVGNTNAPIIPAAILAVVGVVLLTTAGEAGRTAAAQETAGAEGTAGAQETAAERAQREEKQALNKRLETAGWGLFLIMLGGQALVPGEQVPEGVWTVGVGLIMLGLNAARYYFGIRMSVFTIVLGSFALLTGVGELLGLDLPALPILLILIGANIILKPLFERSSG